MKRYKRLIARIIISSGIVINTIPTHLNATGLPTFDITNATQMIIDYTQQLKEFFEYEKQLKALGIDTSGLNSLVGALKNSWKDIENLSNKLQNMDLNALTSMASQTNDTCSDLKSKSNYFSKKLSEEEKRLKEQFKGGDSKLIETQACANMLSNRQAIEDINNNDKIDAQNELQKGNIQGYKEKTKNIQERNIKLNNDNIKAKSIHIATVINSYNEYNKKNGGLREKHQQMKKEINKQVKDLTGGGFKEVTQKEREEAALDIQAKILSMLTDQYELSIKTSNMMAVMMQESLSARQMETQKEIEEREKNKKKLNKDVFRDIKTDYKKDQFGMPEFRERK